MQRPMLLNLIKRKARSEVRVRTCSGSRAKIRHDNRTQHFQKKLRDQPLRIKILNSTAGITNPDQQFPFAGRDLQSRP
jgi:hypothetical protein